MATNPLSLIDTTEQDEDFARFQEEQERKLLQFLQIEEENASDDYLDDERAVALDFYNGEPFGDEEEGRSQLVTRDVAEVVDYMTISLLRTMVSGDNVVEFEHSDGDLAQIVTVAVNQRFFQDQDGYRVIADWIKAGLLEKSAIVKSVAVKKPPIRREAVLDLVAFADLTNSGYEIVSSQPLADDAFDVAWLEPSPEPTRFLDIPVPNEEAEIAIDATDLDDDCEYWAHVTPKTLSQLEEMGFDTSIVTNLGLGEADTALSDARDGRGRKKSYSYMGTRTGQSRKVLLREEYCRFDYNGDLINERLVVHRVGDQILQRRDGGEPSIYPQDEQPGVLWCPFPMPYRLVGQSLADKVMDIQRTRSVALRQTMDGFYFANNPRTYLHEDSAGDNTIDDLLTVRPGAVVRWKGSVKPETNSGSFDAASGISLMEVLNGERESRTGITRLNQGIDADALNKTATGTALMQASGQQIEEYLARNFVEAFGKLMLKKYRLMRLHAEPFQMMFGGEMITVKPAEWPESMDIRARVGLGSGRKEQRLAYRMELLNIQKEALATKSSLVDEQKIYNNLEGVVADAGLGDVDDYFNDPAAMPPREEQPDPAMLEAQAKAQIEAEKLKTEQEKIQIDAMLKERQQQNDAAIAQQKNEQDMQIKAESAALDAQLKRDRAIEEASLAREKFEFEKELARERQAFEMRMATQKASVTTTEGATIPANRPGGDLSE